MSNKSKYYRFRKARIALILGLSVVGTMGILSIVRGQYELGRYIALALVPILIKAFESEEKGNNG